MFFSIGKNYPEYVSFTNSKQKIEQHQSIWEIHKIYQATFQTKKFKEKRGSAGKTLQQQYFSKFKWVDKGI